MKRPFFYMIFLFVAITIISSALFLFFSFKKTKESIHKMIFERMIDDISSLSNNYKKELLFYLPKNENWFEFLKKHPKLQKHLQYDLSLFATKDMKYVYFLGIKNEKYIFLIDGSKSDRAKFGESFEPLNKKEFQILKPHYFFHKKLKSIFLTYVNPVIVNKKIKGVIVTDVSIDFLQFIKFMLDILTKNVYVILFFSFMFFIVVVSFSFFDFKREKEKENLLKQLEKTNKNLEKKVKEKLNELRHKDAVIMNQGKLVALGEMLNMIAHQWRQPLNALSAASIHLELKVEMESLEKEQIIKFTQFVQEEAQRLSGIIDDFMNFSKPDEKKEEFYLRDAIEDVMKIIKVQLENHDIEIKMNIPKNFKIKSYKKVIEHILLNLILNARDALDESNIKNKEIIISVEENNENIKIIVYDNGNKITEDIAKRIFEPYFTTKEEGKGTGLGLYMSKKLAEEKLKGKLCFENRDDGIEFILKLRRKK